MATRLTEHFTLEELTVTDTGLPNTPTGECSANLLDLANTLESIRSLLGNKPLRITSAYRSPEVNQEVGGSKTSAHMFGLAADFTCTGFGSPIAVAKAIAESDIEFDQVIHEYGVWVHIGIGGKNRRETLTIDRHGKRPGLVEARK